MSAPTAPATPISADGAWDTFVRGLRSSPELRVGLRATLVLALLATAGRAIVPVVVKVTIDDGLGGGSGAVDIGVVTLAVAGGALAVVVTAVASSAMNIRLARVVETALSGLRVRAFRHIHDLSSLHQAAEQRGSLVSRVTSDVDEVSRFMSSGGLALITSIGQLAIATVVMLAYSWQLTLIVMVSFVPFVLSARAFQRRLIVRYQLVRQRIADLLTTLAESVVGAPVIRTYGIEERTRARLDRVIEAHRTAAVGAGKLSSAFSGTGEVFAALATAAVVVGGVLLGVAGEVSSGTVTAFLFLITLFIQPVQLAAEVVNEGQMALAGWRRVLDVLDVEPDVADPEDGIEVPAGPIDVRFEDVSFRYPRSGEPAAEASGPVVLDGVEVRIRARSKVAIVGETGSGKTTFAKLLTRLMDPTSGRVLINEVPIGRVSFDSLRRRVVMVPQEVELFDGTIADNIRKGRPDLSDEDLDLALLELGLTGWLEELADGHATSVGERGNALSAGERQLVALARTYVANADLREIELAEKLGIEGLKWLDAHMMQAEVHSPTYLGARWEEQCALINPAKYVRGLKRVALEQGVEVYERTPVEAAHLRRTPHLDTPQGLVEAEKVVFATNAFSGRFPELRNKQFPVFTYIILTEPLSD
ncbi:MAG: FAD-dependent oxidoreductase, partial [Nitriliruptor sp.]